MRPAEVVSISAIEHLDWEPTCTRHMTVHSTDECGKVADFMCIRVCGCELFRCHACLKSVNRPDPRPIFGVCSTCGDCRPRDRGGNYLVVVPLRGDR